ncbi:MAG: glycoside hydrolase family 99-like domain-containing protein [Capsulimonadaceae bacterium]
MSELKTSLVKAIEGTGIKAFRDALLRRSALAHKQAVIDSGFFDPEWYIREYSDVKRAGVDPLEHYLLLGWRENRNPGPTFDTRWYLWKHGDVRVSGVNPLVHYVTAGRKQNRKIKAAGYPVCGKAENTSNGLRKYANQILQQAVGIRKEETEEYVALSGDHLDAAGLAVKAIAFYLPQFHPIPENDTWWGRGFTEWTNVSKAVPQFVGHYQPHLPGELGFYDLRLVEVQERQVELARQHGIHGFCFHHYWFGGKRLLERPVNQFLAARRIDFPFCLCWANENWSRRWDGSESEILIAQRHSPEDDIAFLQDIERALLDERYIRVDGKPLLLVYDPSLLPEARATTDRWREYWSRLGHGDLYLVAARTFHNNAAPSAHGFDAGVEFPPHRTRLKALNPDIRFISPNYDGQVFRYEDLARHYWSLKYPDFTMFRTVSPGWDNTARKPLTGYIFHGSTPAAYAKWLETAAQQTMQRLPEERLLFINAWNEWAEGAHLEPDRRFGYAYLQATAGVLRQFPQAKTEHADAGAARPAALTDH